jgi:hypothetical protein
MPIRPVPGRPGLDYYFVCFDKAGAETPDNGGNLTLPALTDYLAKHPNITDIFVTSHGWKSDVSDAEKNYDRWIGQMADISTNFTTTGAGNTLIVAVHWPSLPWGDEHLISPNGNPGAAAVADGLVEHYADRIANTGRAKAAMRTLLDAGQWPTTPAAAGAGPTAALPSAMAGAYNALVDESPLAATTTTNATAPGEVTPPPDRVLTDIHSHEPHRGLFGGFLHNIAHGGLTLIRQLSFLTMKDRASNVGRAGVHELLTALATNGPQTRLHLMGHSFGCIVVTSAIKGPVGGTPIEVDTLFLVQGAMSLWSFADKIQIASGQPGYYRDVRQANVHGAIVTTHSYHDHAVGFWYPAGAVRGVDITGQRIGNDQFPLVGAVGHWGAHGIDNQESTSADIGDTTTKYGFEAGHVYNIDASAIICDGNWPSGAHSDFVKAPVAHLFWQATLAS